MKICQMHSSSTIDAQLSSQVKQAQELHFKLLLVLLSSLRFLLRQGLAVRGHDEIEGNLMQSLLLRCEDNPKLKMLIKDKIPVK